MNLHVHVHAGVVDGVYTVDHNGKPCFHFLPTLTASDIQTVCASAAARICKLLRRRGLLRDEADDIENPADNAEPSALDACREAALSRGRFERIDPQGRSQQELFPDDDRTFTRRRKSPWAVEIDGFSVEAGVLFGALDRKGRERLVRYMLRPAIATSRFSILRDGSVAYRTKYGRGAKSHRIMKPMEAMARIAALVPPPRLPLLRYHGVLAAGSALRSQIAPVRSRPEPCPVCDAPEPVSKRAKKRKPKVTSANNVEPSTRAWRPSTSYIPWAELMRRTLDIDPAICPKCEGRLQPVAIIRRDAVVERILSHLDLPVTAAPVGPGGSLAYEVANVEEWVVGLDPEAPDDVMQQRGPPYDEWADPPCPDA